jgi:hypothetical protein
MLAVHDSQCGFLKMLVNLLVLLAVVDFSLYSFNLSDAFRQFFKMVKQHRHKDWVKYNIHTEKN